MQGVGFRRPVGFRAAKWEGNPVASNYWSSTTNANNTNNAWNVNFNNGNVNNNNKTNNNYVRAVRAGKCSLLSFRSVYNAYLDCRKRKRGTINALRFEIGASEKLFDLAADLQKDAYQPSRSVCFLTASPKLREVFAADFRDRIVHHLVVRELEKLYEPCFIYDSYACRMRKGTQAAVRRLQGFMLRVTKNSKVAAYALQLDIRSFFTSIDKHILFGLLEQKLMVKEMPEIGRATLLRLLRIIVFHDCTSSYVFKGDRALLDNIPPHKTLFKAGPDKGLPIGNLTSQFFANVYLHELDLFIKQTLRCRFYLRYVDDFLLLDSSPEQLLAWRGLITDFLREKLSLELKADSVPRRVTEGSDFLGYIVRPNYILVRRRVVNNLKAKLAVFRKKMVSEICIGGKQVIKIFLQPEAVIELRQVIASYLGHFRHADAYKLTQSVFEKHAWLNMIFTLRDGSIIERLKYKGCFRSLKIQLFFYRSRLAGCVLLFQVGGYVEMYGRDAVFAGQYLNCRVRCGFRGMDYAAGFPLRLTEKVTQKIVSLGRSCSFIAQGGDGRYVKNRYVREVVWVGN